MDLCNMIKRETLEPLKKEDIINLFVEFAEKVEKQIQQLQDDICSLQEENRQLKTPKNSRNSSQPPSHDFGSLPRQKSLRKPSGKKTGGQQGHTGTTLEQTSQPDKIINHKPSDLCPKCGKIHSADEFIFQSKRQMVDIPPIQPVITEHRVYQLKCKCGHEGVGQFPAGVNAPVKYGNQLTAFVSYLSTRQYVPFGRLPELLKCICNLTLSQGTIYNMLRVADNLLPVYHGIKQNVQNAKVVGSDESGVKVNNDNFWTWTWQTETETFIIIDPSRGFCVIENAFPNGFPQAILVSDSLGAQLKTPALLHQLCFAHLLRELNAFIEVSENLWATKMKTLFEKAIKLKRKLKQEQYYQPNVEREEIMEEFHALLNQPFETEISKLPAFHKRLIKRKDSIFPFLFYYNVPFDNNGSERAIRNIKVKQKVSGGFRSTRGAEIFAIIRSVIDTFIKRGANIFDSLKFAIQIAEEKQHFISAR